MKWWCPHVIQTLVAPLLPLSHPSDITFNRPILCFKMKQQPQGYLAASICCGWSWEPASAIPQERCVGVWCITPQLCSHIITCRATRHSQGKFCHIVIHILHTKSARRQALVTYTQHPHCTCKPARGISNFEPQKFGKPRLSVSPRISPERNSLMWLQ